MDGFITGKGRAPFNERFKMIDTNHFANIVAKYVSLFFIFIGMLRDNIVVGKVHML